MDAEGSESVMAPFLAHVVRDCVHIHREGRSLAPVLEHGGGESVRWPRNDKVRRQQQVQH